MKMTAELLNRAKELKREGVSYKEIARTIGVSREGLIAHFQKGNSRPGPGLCSICGKEVEKRVRHHTDYGDLNQVTPVCMPCHHNLHYREISARKFNEWVKFSDSQPREPMGKCPCCWGTGMELDHEQLGAIARQFRKSRGQSLKVAAKILGITEGYLSLLENGKRKWTEELYRKATR
jgi:transcriptional regulator with XRE-family HTH domain